MDQTTVLQHIKEYVRERFQLTLATYGEHPWIATVYYSFDDDLNLYFLSDPNTLHCQQIAQNPQVAVSISDAPQNPASEKKGLQAFGLAEQISDMHKIKHALGLWRKTLGVTSEAYTYEGMLKKAIKGRMYKITIKQVKFFNEALWKEGKEVMLTLN